MKQVLQSLETGKTAPQDVPQPKCKSGHLLIQSDVSLISAGTERMLLSFGKAGLVGKVRQQPDKVRMVVDKMKTDGVLTTLDKVKNKLSYPVTPGYSNVGTVIEVGEGVDGYAVGDRVVSNGAHADVVCVAKNLCCKIPDGVTADTAAFTVLGAIALQGVRLAEPTLGEAFVVTGLGLIGLMTVQILRANGCRVLGVDFNEDRLALAKSFGAEVVNAADEAVVFDAATNFAKGRGVDGVILTVATDSDTPIKQAAEMCRQRGRIILTGVTGLNLSRDDFYKKELSFQVSCSYGPGRYDADYEDRGIDYPLPYVRWTENRNFEAVLDLMAKGAIDVASLISHRFDIADAEKAYDLLDSDAPSMGIMLGYPAEKNAQAGEPHITLLNEAATPADQSGCTLGCIGAGSYAGSVLLPAFNKTDAALHTVISAGGVSAAHFGRKFGFTQASTDSETVFENDDVNTVVIATRHNSHAGFVVQGLKAGKHVFVEKPLAMTEDELSDIVSAYDPRLNLTVGFNRRYAPHVQFMKNKFDAYDAPKSMVMTVNAGAIPKDHWTQSEHEGGGRIVGEACHFIDLLRFIAGHKITTIETTAMAMDTVTITLGFEDGSMGTIHYFANGHRSLPKERLEVFCNGKSMTLNNFRSLKGYGLRVPLSLKTSLRQDKGQAGLVARFVDHINGRAETPIAFDELVEVSHAAIIAAHQAKG